MKELLIQDSLIWQIINRGCCRTNLFASRMLLRGEVKRALADTVAISPNRASEVFLRSGQTSPILF